MKNNSSLFAEAKRYIPGGVNSPVRAFRNVGGEPFFVSRAKGSHLWDVEGREYIDYVGTWGPAILGHAPEVVVEAVRETAKRGLSFGIPNPLEVEMARLICAWVPSVEKVRMVNSGTEATMSCLRLARGATNRKLIVKFEGCYHGHVDSLLVKAGSGALTHGSPDSAGIPQEFADLTIAISFNDPEALAGTLQKFGEQIAAVIVEAVPANAGLFLPKPGFFFAQSVAREFGVGIVAAHTGTILGWIVPDCESAGICEHLAILVRTRLGLKPWIFSTGAKPDFGQNALAKASGLNA